MHILSLILWTPALGALLAALIPDHKAHLARNLTYAVTLLTFVLTWSLPLGFDPDTPSLQYQISTPWNPELGSYYALGVDGFSLPMVMLSALLSLIAVLASHSLKNRVKGYHVCLMLLEFGMLGVFLAQDWALFYVFWEVTLIPLFFLIDQWGGPRRHTASLNFVLYTMGGSVFMLIGLLMIYTASDTHSTAMFAMAETARTLPRDEQILIFLGLLIGFGVKMPSFPLHGWLPLAHVEAPSPVSILLSGILLKMGAYGMIRAVGMLPVAAVALQSLLAALALLSIVHGAFLAWRQSDLKAMIAYSSISHMGLVLLGIASLSETGLVGASLQMSAHGLIAAALFLLVGLLYERTHTREIADYGSLIHITPRFAVFTTLALLAALGLPGLAGFTAELHILVAGFERFGWWALPVSLGVLVGAAYALRTIARLFTGQAREDLPEMRDLHGLELTAAGFLSVGILVLGLFPAPLLVLIGASVTQLSADLSGLMH